MTNSELGVIIIALIIILYYLKYRESKKSNFEVNNEQFSNIKKEFDGGDPKFSKIKNICAKTTAIEFKDMNELYKKNKLTLENVTKL